MSTPELVFYRFAFGLPPLLIWIGSSRNFGAWRTQRPMAHVSRAMLGLATMVLNFTALSYLPLAEATTIAFAAPLFAVDPLGPGAEGAGRASIAGARSGIGFAGVMAVMQPHGETCLPRGSGSPSRDCGRVRRRLGGTITLRQIGRTEGTPDDRSCGSPAVLAAGDGACSCPSTGMDMTRRTWAILLGAGDRPAGLGSC